MSTNTRRAGVLHIFSIFLMIQSLFFLGLGVLEAQECPALNGSYDFGPLNQSPSDLAAEGGYAYSADTYGLTVYDLSGGGEPVPVGQYLLEQGGTEIAVHNGLAYVADFFLSWDAGMKILDVADPTAPFLVGSFTNAGVVHDIAVVGGLAFIAEEDTGMEIVDVSDPANPVLLDRFDTIGSAYRVCISGNLAYIAEGSSGLEIVDVSSPTVPVTVGS